MDALLLLLLAIGGNAFSWTGGAKTLKGSVEGNKWRVGYVGKSCLEIKTAALGTENSAGVLDVFGRDGLNGILEGGEASDNLWLLAGSLLTLLMRARL
jgi:hypothetical protein